MFGLFKKKTLLVIKADYLSSEKGYRDFEKKTFFVHGSDKDDCKNKLDKHLKKIKADNIYFSDDVLVIYTDNKQNANVFIP